MNHTPENSFSGRFQIRINPNTHQMLSEYAHGLNASMSEVIELALNYSLHSEKFRINADEYFHGILSVVEHGIPKATLVRRNFVSFEQKSQDTVTVCVRVKQGSVWKKWSFDANLNENPHLLRKLESWTE